MQEIHTLLDALKNLGSIQAQIQEIKEELSAIKSAPSAPSMVPEKQISTELNICTKTLRKYRENNILPFVKWVDAFSTTVVKYWTIYVRQIELTHLSE